MDRTELQTELVKLANTIEMLISALTQHSQTATEEVQQLTQDLAYLKQNAKPRWASGLIHYTPREVGTMIEESMNKARYSLSYAKDVTSLLGEAARMLSSVDKTIAQLGVVDLGDPQATPEDGMAMKSLPSPTPKTIYPSIFTWQGSGYTMRWKFAADGACSAVIDIPVKLYPGPGAAIAEPDDSGLAVIRALTNNLRIRFFRTPYSDEPSERYIGVNVTTGRLNNERKERRRKQEEKPT
jgi:hypothetical protein